MNERADVRSPARRGVSAGFTLVEICAALTIVSVLLAVAVPRYLDFGKEAHHASVDASADGFETGMRLASLRCFMRSWANKDNLPGYAAGDVDFNAACYPTDTSGNANTIASNATRCTRVWTAVLALAPSITTGTSGADYRASASNQVCTFRYLRDSTTVRRFTWNSTNGLIVLTNP